MAWSVQTASRRDGALLHPVAVAFYVDNGKQLPVWRDLPAFTYWLIPFASGMQIIVWALLRHPVVNRDSRVLR
jgi:hypothetical protein